MRRALAAIGDWMRRSLPLHPRDPALAALWGLGQETAAGIAVTPELALECPAVYSCIGLLADTIGTIPLDLHRRTGADASERATDHPIHRLLHDRPNGIQTSVEFRQELLTHLFAHGNAYAEVIWRGDGLPAALNPHHPTRVDPFRTPAGGIAYRVQPAEGPARVLLRHEMLHVRRRPFDRDGLRGLSPIVLHKETVGLALAVARYTAKFFGNSAIPKGGLEVPGNLSDRALDVLRDDWDRRHRGAENAHRLAVFYGGMKWVNIGSSNSEAQLLDIYRFLVAEIASRIFGVPPHLVGDTERSTSWGTGIEQQSIGFIVYFVRPLLVVLEQALSAALLTETGRDQYFIEFNPDGLLRGDFKTRMEGLALCIQWGLMTPNEARRLLNLAPLPGGDSRLQPLNMAPAERVMDILLKPEGKATRDLIQALLAPEVAGAGGPFGDGKKKGRTTRTSPADPTGSG